MTLLDKIGRVTHWEAGSLKGFGFADFNSEEDTRAAKEAMEDGEIDGNKVTLDWAKPKGEGGFRGCGGGRGGFEDRGGGRGGHGRFNGRGHEALEDEEDSKEAEKEAGTTCSK